MTDLSDFIEPPPVHESNPSDEHTIEDNSEIEQIILIKSGCTFEDVRTIAIQNRKMHPEDPVEWQMNNKGTYTLNRIVKSNRIRFCR